MSDLRGSARATLAGWDAPTPGQQALREAYLGIIDAREDVCRRSCLPGHLTASALVLDPDGNACLVHHKIVGAWLQPGGHVEETTDETLADPALREAGEETGLPDLVIDPVPVHLDVHPITCRGSAGPTRHFDVRFLVFAPHVPPVVSEESHGVRWFAPAEWTSLRTELQETLAAARQRQLDPRRG